MQWNFESIFPHFLSPPSYIKRENSSKYFINDKKNQDFF
jgi:hypothetical protein